MKRRALIFTVMLMLVSAAAFAQKGPGGHGKWCQEPGMHRGFGGSGMDDGIGRPGMILKFADEIGLSDDQKTQLDKMTQDNGLKRIEMKADLEKAQLQLRHLKMSDGSDTQVLMLMDDIGEIKTEMRKSAYSHHQQIKSVLTEEQINKIQELRKECRGNRALCHGRGPDGGQGSMKGQGRGMVPDSDPEPGQGYQGGRGR